MLAEYMENKNQLEKCVKCNGYMDKCESYTPNSKPGEESAYCSRFVTLREEVKKMTNEEKKQVKDTLGNLLEREIENNEKNHCRPIEVSDMRAVAEA
jgi:hypothetical protein